MNPTRQTSFHSLTSLFEQAITDLLSEPIVPSRNGDTREIIGASFTLDSPTQNVVLCPERRFSFRYAAGETLWYLAGTERGEFIRRYAPSYGRFLEPDGVAYGAYGARLQRQFGFNQITAVIDLLAKDPASRQAVMQMWNPATDLEAPLRRHEQGLDRPKDLPCTLGLQFLIRRGKLHCITTMRSNDVWLGLPYDIFAFTTIQLLIADALGIEAGAYHHRVGSFHLYCSNEPKASEVTHKSQTFPYHTAEFENSLTSDVRMFMGESIQRVVPMLEQCETAEDVITTIGRGRTRINSLYVMSIYDKPFVTPSLLRIYGLLTLAEIKEREVSA